MGKPTLPDRFTADGVAVNVGSLVWEPWGGRARHVKLSRFEVASGTFWGPPRFYATEYAALQAAVAEAHREIARAAKKVLAAQRDLERLGARLAALPAARVEAP